MSIRSIFAKGILLLLALSLPAHAAPEFQNSGTLSGWDGRSLESGTKGTIAEVTNLSLKGGTALKMTQTYIEGYKGRYHAEVSKKNGYRKGQTKFYGFAFRLSKDWEFSGTQNYNLAQFIADFSDTKCDDWMPTTMIYIKGNKLQTRVKTGSVCAQKTVTFANVATVQAGVWHKVVLRATWQSDSQGVFKMWFDGKPVVDKSGIPTTIEESRTFSFRVGLYANGWHDDNGMVGNQGYRQVWYDEIAIGSKYADVNPGNWGVPAKLKRNVQW